jgi:DNA polymerase III delta prime subunit
MDAVLGQDAVVEFLRARLIDPPHLILWGPTGVGKTMLANAWIMEQLTAQGVTKPADQATMTLRLSSADDRGIAAIRQRLTEFVRRVRPIQGTQAWVMIDDADNLPVVTQQALRRILELHSHQTRFCFIAQSPEHFIEPIQSRCVLMQCHPVALQTHIGALLARELPPSISVEEDAAQLIAALCMGNARQATLIARALRASRSTGPVTTERLSPDSRTSTGCADGRPDLAVTTDTIQLLVNAPPVALLLRLQDAIIARDIGGVTEGVLALWSKGYSFEDCIAMLETVVRVYNPTITADVQYVLQCCAEGHVYQILNRMTTLDLIAVLSGRASSEALAEPLTL